MLEEKEQYAHQLSAPEADLRMPPKRAAHYLAEFAPLRTEKQWLAWLQNNRFGARSVLYRADFERSLGSVYYTLESVDRIARIEKARTGATRLAAEDAHWISAQKK